jgi:hypothetical protein
MTELVIACWQECCNKNKEIRSKQVIPHTGGSKPLARKRHEMVMTLIYMV